MYFSKLSHIFLRSYKLLVKDYRFWLIGLFMGTFGFSVQGIRLFSTEYIQKLFISSNSFKIAYISWELLSLIAFVVGGSILFPILILFVKAKENNSEVKIKNLYQKAKKNYLPVMSLLLAYYAAISFLTGGGIILIIQSLVQNILYGSSIAVVPHTLLPLISIYLTIGIIISFFVTLVFIFTLNYMVFEEKSLSESVLSSIKLINKEMIHIFSAWIFINILMLLPTIFLILILHYLLIVVGYFVTLKTLAFVVGMSLFLILYIPVTLLTNIFWSEIFLFLRGKINLSSR